jgi:hypothetical protein
VAELRKARGSSPRVAMNVKRSHQSGCDIVKPYH